MLTRRQFLSIDGVTPDFPFLAANTTNNTEHSWAFRGGRATAFGVGSS